MIAHFVSDLIFWIGLVCSVAYLYNSMVSSDKKTKKKMLKQRGKHVFITGGTSGLGMETALLFAKLGANVTITGRDQEKLDKAVAEVMRRAKYGTQKIGGVIVDYEAHASDKLDPKASIKSSVTDRGPIDILICCAGQGRTGAFGNIAETCAENLMTINYWGTYKTIAEILPAMKERGSGHIVAISHHSAVHTFEGYSAINPTKMAVKGLMETLHSEFSATNIKFQLFTPLPMNSEGRRIENLSKPEITAKYEDYFYDTDDPKTVAHTLFETMQSKLFYTTSGSSLFHVQMIEGNVNTCDNKFMAFIGRQLMSWVHLFDYSTTDRKEEVRSHTIIESK